jgi:anti-sigma regulatory factor (Ser/Thr protein kinase)
VITSEEIPRPAAPPGPPRRGVPAVLAQCAMPAAPESARALRHFAGAVARRWRLHEDCHEALSVIVTELVSNAVLHSGSSWVAVAIKVRDDTLIAEVRDGGSWKHRSGRRREPLDGGAACGRGLTLVDAFANRTVTRRDPVGSVVAAELLMPRPAGVVAAPRNPGTDTAGQDRAGTGTAG